MVRLLRAIDVCSEFLLFLPERRFLLATHRPAGEDHHDWFVPRLFPVGRTARRGLLLFALNGTELLPPLASFLNGGYALSVIRFRLLAGPEDIIFRDEGLHTVTL